MNEIPYILERELVKPMSNRKTRYLVREGIATPESKLTHNCSKVGSSSRGSSQGLTLLLRIWSIHKKGPSTLKDTTSS